MRECYTWIWTWVGSVNSTHNIFSLKCFAPTRSGIWHGNMGGAVQSEVVFPMPYFLLRGHSIQRILWRGLGVTKSANEMLTLFLNRFDSIEFRSIDKSMRVDVFSAWAVVDVNMEGPGGCVLKRWGWNLLYLHSEGTSQDDSLVYGEKNRTIHTLHYFHSQISAKWVIIMKNTLKP